jgi:hypothetical protein
MNEYTIPTEQLMLIGTVVVHSFAVIKVRFQCMRLILGS